MILILNFKISGRVKKNSIRTLIAKKIKKRSKKKKWRKRGRKIEAR